MDAIIVQPATKAEQQLLTSLFKKMGVKSKIITNEQKEDLGLGLLLNEVDRSQKISRSKVMQKLGR